MAIDDPLPSRRQGSKKARNLSVSSRPRVPNYMIAGGIEEKSKPST
jgi:hypothetical protein